MSANLPKDAKERKRLPIYSGVLAYFPDAFAEIARVSLEGNEQHHPGTPLHYDKSKSQDHKDALVRHLLEDGTLDTDGQRHSAKVAWRALANLQKELDDERLAAAKEIKVTGGDPNAGMYADLIDNHRKANKALRGAVDEYYETRDPSAVSTKTVKEYLSDDRIEGVPLILGEDITPILTQPDTEDDTVVVGHRLSEDGPKTPASLGLKLLEALAQQPKFSSPSIEDNLNTIVSELVELEQQQKEREDYIGMPD